MPMPLHGTASPHGRETAVKRWGSMGDQWGGIYSSPMECMRWILPVSWILAEPTSRADRADRRSHGQEHRTSAAAKVGATPLHSMYCMEYIYIYAALTQCRSIWQECLGRQVQSSGLRGSQRSGYSGSKILVTKQTGVRPRGPLGGTAPEIVVPSLSKHPNWSLKT